MGIAALDGVWEWLLTVLSGAAPFVLAPWLWMVGKGGLKRMRARISRHEQEKRAEAIAKAIRGVQAAGKPGAAPADVDDLFVGLDELAKSQKRVVSRYDGITRALVASVAYGVFIAVAWLSLKVAGNDLVTQILIALALASLVSAGFSLVPTLRFALEHGLPKDDEGAAPVAPATVVSAADAATLPAESRLLAESTTARVPVAVEERPTLLRPPR